MRLSAILATTLLAAAAVGQVTIPAHSAVYNGYSRGYNFTSNTGFFIVGLDLPLDAFQVGDTASYLVRVNGAVALRSVGNTGAIPTNIQINTGDIVDVIGNWSPVAAASFTAHNSYGSATAGLGAAPFATMIEGVPHTLMRTGWQWDIGDATWVSTGTTGTILAPTTGQIGRVIMYTSATGTGGVIATNTTLGAGCVSAPDVSSYENFATSPAFDLANSGITLIHTGTGYLAIPLTTTYVAPSAGAQVLALTDDSETTVTLSQPMRVGSTGSTTTLTVCSNGYISSGTGNGTGFTPTPSIFLAGPRAWWCLNWHDYNPSIVGSGQVKFEQIGTIAYITWDGVWDFGGTTTANANTMQAQFDVTTGSVNFVYQTMSTAGNGRLVGFSDGGPSADPGSMDISAALPASYSAATFAIVPLNLAASSRPILGTNWNLNVTNVPATGSIGIDIFGVADPAIPDLGPFGLGQSGCQLHATLDALSAWFVAGSSHGYSFAIPNNPALVNFHLFTQSAVLTLPSLAQTITSQGIDGKLGNL